MRDKKNLAFQFIVLLGIVSLFGDITYEGARSVIGPYLAILGANSVIVGFIAGLGEFLGYGLRLISGYISDRTKAYWPLTILGYVLLLSIPLLGNTSYWQIAAILIILERIGKAIRTPPRDTILSYATEKIGRGLGFGIHEALDQIGAILGPLVFSFVFILKGSFKQGFMILWISATLTLIFLMIAKARVPLPQVFEEPFIFGEYKDRSKLSKIFWFYTLFVFLSVLGFTNFVLISYHFKVQSIVSDIAIPVFYAIAMGVDALVAPIVGRVYDKYELRSLFVIPLLTIPIPFFTFSYSYILAFMGILFWGIVTGIHETTMRAAIADITPPEKRGLSYGIFNTLYGLAWFFGSSIMGFFYSLSVKYLIVFVITTQILSLLFLHHLLRLKCTFNYT
jgi:MFS family permease